VLLWCVGGVLTVPAQSLGTLCQQRRGAAKPIPASHLLIFSHRLADSRSSRHELAFERELAQRLHCRLAVSF